MYKVVIANVQVQDTNNCFKFDWYFDLANVELHFSHIFLKQAWNFLTFLTQKDLKV